MAKSGKKCCCDSNNLDPVLPSCSRTLVDPGTGSRSRSSSRGRSFFPTDIKKLLILIAEDDDNNRADIVLDSCANHCFIEDARVIAVMDNTVIIRDCDKFKFVNICCICEVIVDCDTILDELLEQHSLNRE